MQSPTALAAQIDGEVVALDVEKGVCYGLDRIGARIWAMIAEPRTVASLCLELTRSYEVDLATCRNDVAALLADLAAEGLVRLMPEPIAR